MFLPSVQLPNVTGRGRPCLIKGTREKIPSSLGRWTSRFRSRSYSLRSKALHANWISRFRTHSIRCPLDVKLRFKLDVIRWTSKGIFYLILIMQLSSVRWLLVILFCRHLGAYLQIIFLVGRLASAVEKHRP